MLEKTTIDGKKALVAYIDDDFNPVPRKRATSCKVIFEDGRTVFMTKDEDGQWPLGGN